jgi:membrane fusion protein, multidrug efflux system
MSSATTAEIDAGSAQARVISAPVGRDLKRATRRSAIKRFLLAGLALSVEMAVAGTAIADGWPGGSDDAYVGGEVTVIAPKVSGLIAEVAVTDNQAVHAGDLLVKLDDRDYRAALAKAAGAVAAQEAALANIDATGRLQESMIAQAAAELAAADAEVARSQSDVERYRRLASDQYASLQRFQQADADNRKAIAAVDKARAVLAAAQRRLDVIDTQKQEVRGALAQAVADRDLRSSTLALPSFAHRSTVRSATAVRTPEPTPRSAPS